MAVEEVEAGLDVDRHRGLTLAGRRHDLVQRLGDRDLHAADRIDEVDESGEVDEDVVIDRDAEQHLERLAECYTMIDDLDGLDKTRFRVLVVTLYSGRPLEEELRDCDDVTLISLERGGKYDFRTVLRLASLLRRWWARRSGSAGREVVVR